MGWQGPDYPPVVVILGNIPDGSTVVYHIQPTSECIKKVCSPETIEQSSKISEVSLEEAGD